ncbi:hypothetical protein IQ277_32565 [Nostocales cyanobacterium LEGE 12452]|nr:hypothetical protein [Nostocales cyanobacterium LEGE 12452]
MIINDLTYLEQAESADADTVLGGGDYGKGKGKDWGKGKGKDWDKWGKWGKWSKWVKVYVKH